jgi:hypothetical protein
MMGVDQNGRDTIYEDAGPDASGAVGKSLNARTEARQPTAAHEAARARTVGPQYPVAFASSDAAAPAYSATPKVIRPAALSPDPTRMIVDQGAAYPTTTSEAAREAARKRTA